MAGDAAFGVMSKVVTKMVAGAAVGANGFGMPPKSKPPLLGFDIATPGATTAFEISLKAVDAVRVTLKALSSAGAAEDKNVEWPQSFSVASVVVTQSDIFTAGPPVVKLAEFVPEQFAPAEKNAVTAAEAGAEMPRAMPALTARVARVFTTLIFNSSSCPYFE